MMSNKRLPFFQPIGKLGHFFLIILCPWTTTQPQPQASSVLVLYATAMFYGRFGRFSDGRTDGQTLLWRCEDASNKGSSSFVIS